jgi:carboxyl-terminal processing protease
MKIDRFAPGLAAGAVLGSLLTLALATTAQTAARTPLPLEDLRMFADAYDAIKTTYVEPVEDKKLIANCVSGMLSGLDDRSEYYDAVAFRELTAPAAGIAGIGLELNMIDGLPNVVSAIDDTPASRAGLQSGDTLMRIDGVALKGKPLREAVTLLRGKAGSEVRLSVLRRGERGPLELALQREVIRVASVKADMLEGGIAYLRVSRLADTTPRALAGELARLYRGQTKPKGVVLDLRNNPGGLFKTAIAVSAIFLPEDALVVTLDGRSPESKARYTANPKDYLGSGQADFLPDLPAQARTVPLAVVVNRGSASGTEIIAGALQDHKRAVIVGEKTFGLGSIQTILPMKDNSALKLTTARWYTPNGGKIQGRGIIPDIMVDAASPDPKLDAAPGPRDAVVGAAASALSK